MAASPIGVTLRVYPARERSGEGRMRGWNATLGRRNGVP